MPNNPDQTTQPVRVAMWSGPRNISTALLRSWDSRRDTFVSDEPLYGHYLSLLPEPKRLEHPGANEIIAAMDCDWRSVTSALLGPVPGGKAVWYQKHMAHHLTPGMDLGWTDRLTNCLLIRDPAAMIASFIKVIPDPTPEDLGLPAQVMLFERILERTGKPPCVVDSSDVLRDPAGVLTALCREVGLAFDPAMLAWKAGPRDTDGVWAPHWYANVEASTGFGSPTTSTPDVPDRLLPTLRRCQALYAGLFEHRLSG